ncbi:MAG: asparagine synthase-related protein [Acidobacteriaceae bacterium]
MAGIAGIYCADGRPAEVADLRRMTSAVEHRGVDGITYWNAGPVAFAHLQFCTTPESLEERQPLVSPGGEACLVWNGRLDNREELIAALDAAAARMDDRTDPGLVLAAYLLWGTDCVQRLVGDFAMVVWDARQRRLWCARDYIGVRPFYYFWDGKTFLFGPEIRALLAHPLVSLKINEGMVGEYLAVIITSREQTLYSDIRRLPSGSTLTIDATGSLRIASWWNPDLSLLHYRNEQEYNEHFRTLFDQSVRAHMRSNTRVGVSLSGGMDSSSIAVTAQALLNNGGSGEKFFTCSNVSPGKPWDESEYIAEIVQFAGLQSDCCPVLGTDERYFQEWAAWSREFPDYPNGAPMLVPLWDLAKRSGVRVLLSGIGGNEWLDGNQLYLRDLVANLVRTKEVRQSLRLAREHWGSHRHASRYFLRRLFSEGAPDWMHAQRKKVRLARQSMFSREFLRRTKLGDRLYAPERDAHQFSSREQKDIFHCGTRAFEVHALEVIDRDEAHAQVEGRHPFLDRRFAEFCLRLPREQRERGIVWKWVLREAMRGRLPERVRTRTSGAEFSELYESVLFDPWARARLDHLTIHQHTDWLDAGRVAAQTNWLGQPDSANPAMYRRIWMVLGVDMWLENLLSSGGRV